VAVQRPFTGLPDIDYPWHDKTIVVTRCGHICLGKNRINFSQVFASLPGRPTASKKFTTTSGWSALTDDDLGYVDLSERTLQPLDNPFGPQV
jgi:putative transposase